MRGATGRILTGDCLATMPTLPAGCAHVAITSPPYFALRSYLPVGHPDKSREIGSEPTPEAFVATMVAVFREVRRVLRDDGVLVINLGDSYNGAGDPTGCRTKRCDGGQEWAYASSDNTRTGPVNVDGLGKQNQLLIPHRVALALQADGWCLRSTIVWSKPSPMPESLSGWRWRRCRVKVRSGGTMLSGNAGALVYGTSGGLRTENRHGDTTPRWSPCPGCPKCLPHGGYVLRRGKWRPTTAHEYIFMFSKGGDYFCDGDAVAERATCGAKGSRFDLGKSGVNGDGRTQPGYRDTETRNPRSVMSFANEPFKGHHFATYPSSLPKRFIEAATSKAGCCPACGACYAPVVESERVATRPGESNQIDESGMANRDPQRHVARNTVTGYRPTCACDAGEPVPCVVFDPFMGSGQTARAAHWLGRDWLGCELNPAYAAMIPERIAVAPKWARTVAVRKAVAVMPTQRDLFPQERS